MRTVTRIVDDPTARYGFRREPATYEVADAIVGFRLDRRINYMINREGEVEQLAWCTLDCSGCSCDCSSCSYGYTAHKPGGCQECGGTGKRRHYFGFPPRPTQPKHAYKPEPKATPTDAPARRVDERYSM